MKSVVRIVTVLVMVLLVAGCGDSENDNLSVDGGKARSEVMVTPTSGEENAPSATTPYSGKLVYTLDSELYVRDLSRNTAPEQIDSGIDSTHLDTNPPQTSVFYSKSTGIYQYDLANQTITQFVASATSEFRGDPFWRIEQWSPDGQWVLLRGRFFEFRGIGVIRADGTGLVDFDVDQNTLAFWLNDNRLLIMLRQINLNTTSFSEVSFYDPANNTRQVADVDLTQFVTEQDLVNWLASQNAALAYPLLVVGDLLESNVMQTPQESLYLSRKAAFDERFCDTWEVYRQEVDEEQTQTVLFQVPSVGAISDVQLLADGNFVFIRWTFPECNFLATPVAELVLRTTDGTEQVLSNELGRIADRNTVNDSETYKFHRFAVSPDEQYVAWLGTSNNETSSTLNITTLASGETTTLETDNTIQAGGFKYVLWLD